MPVRRDTSRGAGRATLCASLCLALSGAAPAVRAAPAGRVDVAAADAVGAGETDARREAATLRGVAAYGRGDYSTAYEEFAAAYTLYTSDPSAADMGSARGRGVREALLGSLRGSLRALYQQTHAVTHLCRLRRYQREYLEAWLTAEPGLRRDQVQGLLTQLAEVDAALVPHTRGGLDPCAAPPTVPRTWPRTAAPRPVRTSGAGAAGAAMVADRGPSRGGAQQALGWALLGAGAGLLGAGMGTSLAVRGHEYRQLLRIEAETQAQPLGLTTEQVREAQYHRDRGDAMRTPAIVTGVLGAVLVIAGAALLGDSRARGRRGARARTAWLRRVM